MEDLAFLVTFMLLVIYGSGLLAFGLSWARSKDLLIVALVFAALALATGFWLAVTLIEGNGLLAGGIPALLGALGLINVIRRWNVKTNQAKGGTRAP
jgi:hypothetical protein